MTDVRDKYEAVIGLEVHAQLLTDSKIFCSAPNQFGSEPNSNIDPVSSGQPGTLPVINKKAIELGVKAGLAIEGTIHPYSVFSRKHYFYPDLPKGYQITQYDKPYCEKGRIHIALPSGESKTIGVTRIHFEEDAGKSTHHGSHTLVNLNRAGVPLIEIVSEPEMRSPEEAGLYLRKLHGILKFAEVCDGNLEKGNFRCDANVSVRLKGETELGTRTELKNINSFRFIEKAIEYEIHRQINLIESGEKVRQQTRLWNTNKSITEVMREKENESDYRYFPEPDLPPLELDESWIEEVKQGLPELPDAMKARLVSQHGVSEYQAELLTSSKELVNYFEQTLQKAQNAELTSNWITNDLIGALKKESKELSDCLIKPTELGILISKIHSGELSAKMAKTVFEQMFKEGGDPEKIINAKGLKQISDASQLESIVKKIIQDNPGQAAEYKNGKIKLLGFFVGQAMKETKGQANPALLNQIVKKFLD